jgi:hypothetical protein
MVFLQNFIFLVCFNTTLFQIADLWIFRFLRIHLHFQFLTFIIPLVMLSRKANQRSLWYIMLIYKFLFELIFIIPLLGKK